MEGNKWKCNKCTSRKRTPKQETNRKKEQRQRKRDRNQQGERIRILQWNADGIRSKKSELAKVLQENYIDVALIQETKLTRKCKFEIQGYKTVRKDREEGRDGTQVTEQTHPGGGLAILVRHGIGDAVRNLASRHENDKTTEIQNLEIGH